MADSARVIAGVARGPFLILTLLCVLQGIALAVEHTGDVSRLRLLLIVVAALAAHILVNVLNELADFLSGLDLHTERTPFSGGSGTLPSRPEGLKAARLLAAVCLAVLLVSGLWLVWLSGPVLLGFGALGLATVLAYSGWLSRHPWFCLLAPGIGFGPCMIAASEYALTGHLSLAAWGLSAVTAVMVSALLLMNQLPDRAVDARYGRRHLAIVYGSLMAVRVYLFMVISAALLLIAMVVTDILPVSTLLALIPFSLLPAITRHLRHHHQGGPGLTPALGLNVVLVNGVLAFVIPGLLIG